MSNGQSYAISIEHILCNVFKCERFGFGGIVDSDNIRRQPLTAMISGLAFLYDSADSVKKQEIDAFIKDNLFYSEMSVDELLCFDSSSKIIDGIEIDIGYKNGIEAIEKIIENFRIICE